MNAGKPILVVYYSLTGNTERVARDIASRLDADLEKIEDGKNRRGLFGMLGAVLDSVRKVPARIADVRHDASDYALTVIGTPVWASKMTPAVRAYLDRTRGSPNAIAFFTTSGNTGVEPIALEMQALAARPAIASVGFLAGDLEDAAAYDGKISAFVQTLRGAGLVAPAPA